MCDGIKLVMIQRFYLDSIEERAGTISFTLVFESPSTYFVERYNDSRLSFMKERLKKIPWGEMGQYWVNGIQLNKLVKAKLQQI